MKNTDIIIPTHGNPDLVYKCIGSIQTHTKGYRIIWIDNLPAHIPPFTNPLPLPHLQYVPQPEPIGYIKAINAGLALSTAPYICLLNSDTEVTEGWLEKLKEPFSQDSKVGAVGPRTDNPRQEQGNCQPNFGFYTTSNIIKGVHPSIDLSFFCILISRECFEDVGYLDDKLSPCYGEDDDWLIRAHLKGWRFGVQTDALVKHVGQATWLENRGEIQRRNQKYLEEKWKEFIR